MPLLIPITANGNEDADAKLDAQFKIKGGNVVFIGIAGLACLRWINEVMAEKNLDTIPKLYVYDISLAARNLWDILQCVARKSKDIIEFESGIESINFDSTGIEVDNKYKSSAESIIDGVKSLGNYPYFRAVISNVTFEDKDWSHPGVFNKISAAHPNAQFVVYASNILEFVSLVENANPATMRPIMDNILTVKPLFTIHTRTHKVDQPTHTSVFPRQTMVLSGNCESAEAHIMMLHYEGLVPFSQIQCSKNTPLPIRTILPRSDFLHPLKISSLSELLAIMGTDISKIGGNPLTRNSSTTAVFTTQAPKAMVSNSSSSSEFSWMKKGFLNKNKDEKKTSVTTPASNTSNKNNNDNSFGMKKGFLNNGF